MYSIDITLRCPYMIIAGIAHETAGSCIAPIHVLMNGGKAHERYEYLFVTSYRMGTFVTKEITASSSQLLAVKSS